MVSRDYKSSRNGGLEVKASEHEGKDTRSIFSNVGIDIDKDLPNRWSYQYEESKEADDLIAELTMKYLMKDYKVVILSADTDLFQMLRYPNVRIHNFRKEITEETVKELTGVLPHQYADWKSLVGDASDSIPGVPNLGKSKTTKLLQKHDKLEEIPLDEFRVYYAKSPVELANKTRQIREENGWSISKCKKEYGSAWVSLENGDDVKMNSEQVRKLTQAFDISGYLIFDDYYNKALMWKRLVRLPFGDGQSEMPKSVN
jgi:5'-3' exonuclease